ncbi:glycosyltransferase [Polymorphospora sp. NPDC050346]|uniref:glycosyltransferase n=1 Tax=Polymorphospora sp. NPDC050346 TaxID=3155780 RepID=UPI0033D55CF4
MSHLLIASVHRIHAGQSGEAVHLRQLTEALRATGERVTVLDGPMDPGRPSASHEAGLRSLADQLDTLLARDRPDAALLWGHLGEETELVRRLAAADVPTVLEHPAADLQPVPETLRLIDEVVVPSEFARRLFGSQTGRQARAIEPCLRGCDCPSDTPREPARSGPYRLTFINPEPAKGLGVVMHLVAAASAAKLPFRFRFVEGRWTAAHLARLGIDPADLPGVEIVEYRADICALYAETDLLLVPSLWQESFGMVAREAVIHGVPVVATRVGGLPQAVRGGGVCLEPPQWGDGYQVTMTAAEVRVWLAAVATALRGAHRPLPGLLSRTTADSVRAYRAVLGSSAK